MIPELLDPSSTPSESLPAFEDVAPDAAALHLIPEALVGWRSRFRAEHLGLVVTLSYLFLAALGALHEALLFTWFRINILDFAGPSDFLLAALRDPLIIVVSLVAVPLVALYFRFIARMNLRHRKKRRWWMSPERQRRFVERHFTTLFVLTTLLYAWVFALGYSLYVARRLRAGDGHRVQVELVTDPGHMQRDTATFLMLGATQKYLFLYDPTRQLTSIVPSTNIARILVERRHATRDASVRTAAESELRR